MAGSLYLSRLERFKNQRRQNDITKDEPSPIRLNKYGIPSNLGDSFEPSTPHFQYQQHHEEEEEEEEEEESTKKNVVGLLNQFYDLNNRP